MDHGSRNSVTVTEVTMNKTHKKSKSDTIIETFEFGSQGFYNHTNNPKRFQFAR